jgi:ABC-type Fe3+ transport system substrate-binding protein
MIPDREVQSELPMRRKDVLLAGAAAVVASYAPRAAWAQSEDALYAAARREGVLSLCTGGIAAAFAGTAAAFGKQYPGITVSVNGDYSNVTDLKIDRQLRENLVEVDVANLQTVADFVRWKNAGELQPFHFDGWAGIDAAYKDPDGAYVGLTINPLAYGYNSKLVPLADVPASALDFLKPQFHGQAITCYPHDDDATLYLFYTLEEKYGAGFIEKYMGTQPEFVQGHAGVIRAITTGKKLVTFDCITKFALDAKAAGQPIETVFSPSDATPLFYTGNAIFRRAPHPNAAKLFLSWYVSADQQRSASNYSTRPDVPTPAGYTPLSAVRVANRYREFLADSALVGKLRRRYLAYSGPIVNR